MLKTLPTALAKLEAGAEKQSATLSKQYRKSIRRKSRQILNKNKNSELRSSSDPFGVRFAVMCSFLFMFGDFV